MQLLKTKVYDGPNPWSRLPVLEAYLDLDSKRDHAPSVVSAAIHSLHQISGVACRAFPPTGQPPSTVYVLPFEFEEQALLTECIATALRICQLTPLGQPLDFAAEERRLVDLADDIRLGPSSRAILQAAAARGIPFFRMNQGSLVQFGEGALQRRTWTAETDATSAIAESIASDKQLTRAMLIAVGVNVPQGRSVVSRQDAWQAAMEVGLPVAVKPRGANHAVGVSLDLSDQAAVMEAYDWACQAGHTTDVLVEQFIRGDHHRLLVIGGKMVAAAKGQREYVYGDGVSSIRQLVEQLNSDPRRGENYTDLLQVVKLDDAATIVLGKQGLNFDSIPKRNQQILVMHVGDLIEDCTDVVHPTTCDVAVLAARTIGLDIAGLDVVATDISQPLSAQRGCIIEVNAGPSLTPHVNPLMGVPRPVGEAVVDLLYPQNRPSRIPIIVSIEPVSQPDTIQSLAASLQQLGFKVGVASPQARPSDHWPIVRPLSQFRSLLIHPFVSAIVADAPVSSVAELGLPCSHAEFVIISSSVLQSLDSCSETTAALTTVLHLLQDQGTLVIVGQEALDKSTSLNLPKTRVLTLKNFHQVGEILSKHLRPLR